VRLDRRSVAKAGMLAFLGSLAAKGLGSPLSQRPPRGLATLGAAFGMQVGIQSSTGRFTQSVLGEFLHRNFNMITPPLKWTNIHPRPDVYDFAAPDHEIAYSKAHGLAVHGHNLCWNSYNPEWFGSVLTKQNASDYLTGYIKAVVGRYRGQIDSWDVINEPIALWNRQPGGLRAGPWLQLIGPDYIDVAFHTTRATDPSCLRTLNLNGCEDQSSSSVQEVRAASLNLLKALLRRGVPIQAVALESHINGPWRSGDIAFTNFLRDLRDTGVQVYISEFDVNDTAIAGSPDQVEAVVAQTYCSFLRDVLSIVPIKRLIFWTSSDRFDWYGSLAVTEARWRRPDGKPHHVGLTDYNFVPNSAYESLQQLLADHPHKNAKGRK
jgi:endo-1,4-beta-xylanase